MRVAIIHNLPVDITEQKLGPLRDAFVRHDIGTDLVGVTEIPLGTWNTTGTSRGCWDGIFWRVISARHLLPISSILENLGFPVVNSAVSLSRTSGKLAAFMALKGTSVPVVPWVPLVAGTSWAEPLWEMWGPTVVVKPNHGMWGRGVRRTQNLEELKSLAVLQPEDVLWVGQPHLEHDGNGDIRLLVVDGKVVGGAIRKPKAGEWRSNSALGSESIPFHPSETQTNYAVEAAETLGLTVAGVDMIETSVGPVILEVNPHPIFTTPPLEEQNVFDAVARALVKKLA